MTAYRTIPSSFRTADAKASREGQNVPWVQKGNVRPVPVIKSETG